MYKNLVLGGDGTIGKGLCDYLENDRGDDIIFKIKDRAYCNFLLH